MVPSPYPADGAAQWFSAVSPRISSGDACIFAVTEAGAFRGLVSINKINMAARSAELDYWIAHDWQSRGFGTRAVALAMTHGVDRLNLCIFNSTCLTKNTGSIKVLEKNGFTRVGSAVMTSGKFRGVAFDHYRRSLHVPD